MQHEIVRSIPLLDKRGNLTQAGYARKLLPVYNRAAVRRGVTRLKEWDRYFIQNDGVALVLSIAENSCTGLDSISLLDLREGWEVTKNPVRLFSMGRTGLPSTSETGNVAVSGRGYALLFQNDRDRRVLTAHMDDFFGDAPLDAHIILTWEPPESMVIAIPFDKPGHFCFSQKISCMRASGVVMAGGKVYTFTPADSFGTLDWGRGMWTCRSIWYRGGGSGLVNGVPFGFYVGCGLGDDFSATENMLLYDGRVHKLSRVTFRIPQKNGRDDDMSPWRFSSDDGRFEMGFVPMPDRASRTGPDASFSGRYPVFGKFTGTAVLDDGVSVSGDLNGEDKAGKDAHSRERKGKSQQKGVAFTKA